MINPSRQALVCCGSILILVSFILVITHGSEQCSLIQGTTTDDCSQGIPCIEPAFGTSYLSSLNVQYNLTCPWSTSVSIISYVSLVISAIFLGIFAHSQYVKPNTSWLGVLGTLCLLTSFVLMIIDLVNGYSYINSMDSSNTDQTYSQGGFIANTVFITFTLVLMIIATAIGIRSSNKEANLINEE